VRDFSPPGGVTGPGDGRVSKPEEASLPLKPLHAARLTYMRAALPAPASSGSEPVTAQNAAGPPQTRARPSTRGRPSRPRRSAAYTSRKTSAASNPLRLERSAALLARPHLCRHLRHGSPRLCEFSSREPGRPRLAPPLKGGAEARRASGEPGMTLCGVCGQEGRHNHVCARCGEPIRSRGGGTRVCQPPGRPRYRPAPGR
jgi:ribosomal protein L32